MFRRAFFILFGFGFLFLCSCTRKPRLAINQETIIINDNSLTDKEIEKVINVVDIIQLKTDLNAFIGKIVAIKKTNQGIFIVSSHKLLRFSMDGIYLNSFGSVGKGPGEYLSMSDFLIDPSSSQVEIMDRKSDKILFFTIDGKFLQEVNLHMDIRNFTKIADNEYFLYNQGMNSQKSSDLDFILFHMSINGNKVNLKGIIPSLSGLNYLSENGLVFNQDHDTTYFQHGLNDTIYQFFNSSLIRKMKIDFNNKVNLSTVSKMSIEEVFKLLSSPQYARVENCIINSNFVYISYVKDFRLNRFVLDRKTESQLCFKRLLSDKEGISFEPMFIDENSNFMTAMNAIDFLNYKFLIKTAEKFGLKIDNSDNPIILIYKYII